jgi:hypothetical protein
MGHTKFNFKSVSKIRIRIKPKKNVEKSKAAEERMNERTMTFFNIVSLVVVVAGVLPSTTNNFFAEGFSTVPPPLLKGSGQNNNKALWLSSSVADDFMKKSTTPAPTTKRKDRSESTSTLTTQETLLLTSLSSAAATAAESGFVVDNNNVLADADTAITAATSRHKFTPLQHIIRVLPFITTGLYLYNPLPLDTLVKNTYSLIYNWDVAQQPLFEGEVAVFGFFISIIFFSSMHLFLGDEKTKQSRFDGKLPHKPFEWAEPKNWHLWFNPTASYLGSIYIYLHYFHDKPPLPIEAPTFGVLAAETIFGIVLYDLCFMPIHFIMHNIKNTQIRKIHGYHHRSGSGTKKSLNSLETVQHSYIDGFLQVFVNIVVQQISPFGGPKHVLSRLIHNLSVTYLLSEAHSGYSSLELMSHNIYPEIFGGAPRHETHHHNGRVYYQQYFKYIDDFFGFVIKEDVDGSSSNNAKDTTITTKSTSTIAMSSSMSSMSVNNTTTDIIFTVDNNNDELLLVNNNDATVMCR